MRKNFLSDPDFDLIDQFLPRLNATHDELHRLLPRYRELCRTFRSLLLYILPAPIEVDPLASSPDPRRILAALRDEMEAASDIADALFQLEHFNGQTSAVCASLSTWLAQHPAPH